jgi:hypothetical protein
MCEGPRFKYRHHRLVKSVMTHFHPTRRFAAVIPNGADVPQTGYPAALDVRLKATPSGLS